jgi:hypothetical protein
VRIFSQRRVQETERTPAGVPQRCRLNPTTKVGDPVGNLDHAAVPVPNGMQFDASVKGYAPDVCLQTDEAYPPAVVRRASLTARLPLSTRGAKDGARLHVSRRQTGWLHSD